MSQIMNTNHEILITNIITSWKKCNDNHIYIENVCDSTIKIGKDITINNEPVKSSKKLDKKISVFIVNCKNSRIKITNTFNHIVMSKCSNTFIDISHGLISGIDIIHSNNISCHIKFSSIYYLACCYSSSCNLIMDECFISDTLSTTSDSYKIKFILHQNKNTKEYITNMSLFSDLTYFVINKNNKTGNVSIFYHNKHGNGEL